MTLFLPGESGKMQVPSWTLQTGMECISSFFTNIGLLLCIRFYTRQGTRVGQQRSWNGYTPFLYAIVIAVNVVITIVVRKTN